MGNMTKNLPSRAKLGLHGIQAVLIFIAWSITIALLVQSGSSGSGPKFYFAMVREPVRRIPFSALP
jgi:hypothetical protein